MIHAEAQPPLQKTRIYTHIHRSLFLPGKVRIADPCCGNTRSRYVADRIVLITDSSILIIIADIIIAGLSIAGSQLQLTEKGDVLKKILLGKTPGQRNGRK